MFRIIKKSKINSARLTELNTACGKIVGPFFMPIATRGAVKNLTTNELKDLGAQIILANTYHFLIRPGIALMKKYGGLHKFMNWSGPILTDSGGFQVFSLAKHRKITEPGVHFLDPQNGKKYFLSPEKVIQIQRIIGSDIIMVLDDVIGYPATKKEVAESMERTTRWARRCNDAHRQPSTANRNGKRSTVDGKQLLFAIIQGSIYKDLRIESAKQLTSIGFDGYAIGGVAVGEPREKMKQVLEWVIPELPENKPRYLMGVGRPEEIIMAVKQGIDMFDCVIPTREARHGRLYLWNSLPPRSRESCSRRSRKVKLSATRLVGKFYQTININNAKFAKDLSPINSTNLKQYSKAYLHHLFKTNEPLGMRLATINNLDFYLTLMAKIRQEIKAGRRG